MDVLNEYSFCQELLIVYFLYKLSAILMSREVETHPFEYKLLAIYSNVSLGKQKL